MEPSSKMHNSKHSLGKTHIAGRAGQVQSPALQMSSATEAARLSLVRRPTPDSEAIMSSDDEREPSRSIQSLGSSNPRPVPRTENSWLNDVHSGPPRRASATTTTSNLSQPGTPFDHATDAGAWPFQSPLSRVSSHPMGTSWNTASPWGPTPVRIYHDDNRSLARDSRNHSMPVHPIAKTSRSQSYSVGQMTPEAAPDAMNAHSGSLFDRQRNQPSQQFPYRPVRPSMLSEVYEGSDPHFLHDHHERGSYAELYAISSGGRDSCRGDTAKTSHNPILRHATRTSHGHDSTILDARDPAILQPHHKGNTTNPVAEYDPAKEADSYHLAGLTRRFSELPGLGYTGDVSRRAQWHSSMGFGVLPDIPQSRRHSVADVLTRRNSLTDADLEQAVDLSSIASTSPILPLTDPPHASVLQESYQRDQQARSYAQSYFSGVGPAIRSRIESSQIPTMTLMSEKGPYHGGPAQGMFTRPGQDTPLYLVSFKCARADVYYLAPNTGLDINEGDMVIVEADRGHDLGTVLNAKISWTEAKELKIKATEDHYRWLMMFSQHNQSSESVSNGGTGGMMAGSASERPGGQYVYDPNRKEVHPKDAELKPKMIKRVAQSHEIAILSDKEGNEAKAKRICQQKNNEIKLGMEILDAEFQTDWKKLTFFFYSKTYVNFKPLVTELFKIYKTRIWMSAVNPASLVTTVPPPRLLSPGAVQDRDTGGLSRGSISRQHGGHAEGFDNGHYPTNGLYHNPTHREIYDYGNGQIQQQHRPLLPSQQNYDMMAYSSQTHHINQQYSQNNSYGWGVSQNQAGPSYGVIASNNYSTNPLSFGAPGLGMPAFRHKDGMNTGGFGPPGGASFSMAPLSPPGAQSSRRL